VRVFFMVACSSYGLATPSLLGRRRNRHLFHFRDLTAAGTPPGVVLPAGRHGTGLLSLQTFILLLEIGRERRSQGKPFMLAMEEPELHIPPGLQRRLIAQAISIAEQTLCTSHSPRIAAFYPATAVQILEKRQGQLAATPILPQGLDSSATQAARKLYHDDRARFVEALMHHRVLIPEGRSEWEWLRLLADALETGDQAIVAAPSTVPPFSAIIGVVPTHDCAVTHTYQRLQPLRSGIVVLVDGDDDGNSKIAELKALAEPPAIIIQWPDDWTIENSIGWILKAAEDVNVQTLRNRIDCEFDDVDSLIALFKIQQGAGRLKTDYLAYEEVAATIRDNQPSLSRTRTLLEAITLASLGRQNQTEHLVVDNERSDAACLVIRIQP
jgi:putative ATP-dependent endonuclease of the OLD family